MHAQLYLGIVLESYGIPSPHHVCAKFFEKKKRPVENLIKLSLIILLNQHAKTVLVSDKELKFVDLWAKSGFPGIYDLPEAVLFRLFQVVQQLGLRVVCVWYGMHTMFSICPKFSQDRSTIVSHQDYHPQFWEELIEKTRIGRVKQPMLISISANPIQKLSISKSRLKFFSDHPEWLVTICNSEIPLETIDGHILFSRNITFDTCFFSDHRILTHFRRVANCRFCDVIGSHEHEKWMENRNEFCEL